MPAFRLSDDEVKALVIFLRSRRGVNFNETSLDRYRASLSAPPPVRAGDLPLTIEPTAEMTSLGEQLIHDRACLACHKLGAEDGGVAPDLSWEGLMRGDTWLLEHFRNPRGPVSDSIMPTFQYRDEEFQAMTAYLLSLDQPQPHADPAAIYKEVCARCHGESGAGDGPIAVYIDPAPRDLTKVAFMNSKTMERLATSIRDGVPGTSMPPLARVLGDENVEPLLEYVFAEFVKRPRREIKPRSIPETNPVAMADDSVARGEATYLLRCTGCHGLKADGKGPNSLDIIPRPRNLLNGEFMNSLSDQRLFESLMYGIQGTAMPPWVDYGLSRNDVGDLVNYIRSLNSGG
jgi:cytochrome c oxidase cbb3-type subunit 2